MNVEIRRNSFSKEDFRKRLNKKEILKSYNNFLDFHCQIDLFENDSMAI